MISLLESEQGGTYTTLGGHRVFCREGGPPAAPALVLIHGIPTASWDFEALWGPLIDRYRVITLVPTNAIYPVLVGPGRSFAQ